MQNFSVKPGMVGFKFGEFIRTKRLGAIIHQTGKKAKKAAARKK
jgi:ribosomal protein S19